MADEQPNFHGIWILDRNDDQYEDFLRENGANWLQRKMAVKLTDEMNIDQKGNDLSVVNTYATVRREARFTVGEPYDDQRPDGTMARVSPRWEGSKLIVESKTLDPDKGKDVTVIREMDGNELKQTMKCADVVACRYFKKKPN